MPTVAEMERRLGEVEERTLECIAAVATLTGKVEALTGEVVGLRADLRTSQSQLITALAGTKTAQAEADASVKKSWIEKIGGPLAAAVVGALGTAVAAAMAWLGLRSSH